MLIRNVGFVNNGETGDINNSFRELIKHEGLTGLGPLGQLTSIQNTMCVLEATRGYYVQ
jgi:hypothetical protein